MLDATFDRYKGVEVVIDEVISAEIFHTQLTTALDTWTAQGKRRVWLRIPAAQSSLIPTAVAFGFEFHQVLEPDLMLVKPLVDGTYIPPNASHSIGAGGVVINDKNELLTIVERNASRPDYFKLPGGMIDEGEHLAAGIEREVLEETGVKAEFESIVFIRQTHRNRSAFGKSNYYVICRLRPLTTEITLDPVEIAICKWMPVDEYLSTPIVTDFNKLIVRAALESSGLHKRWLPGYGRKQALTELFMPTELASTVLYRPMGQAEYDLVEQTGFKAWPPRLPEQPIFYPVTNEAYAAEIAQRWNTTDAENGNVGYVSRFRVSNSFLDRYDIQTVGARHHTEYWIPADDLPQLNANIVGQIEITQKFSA